MRFLLYAMLVWYGWEENKYFGWNAFPQSQTELITDGISCIMFVLVLIYVRICDHQAKG